MTPQQCFRHDATWSGIFAIYFHRNSSFNQSTDFSIKNSEILTVINVLFVRSGAAEKSCGALKNSIKRS